MRRLTANRLIAAVVLAAALAACGDKQKPAEGDASGEVLEGSISDDMLPLERLQSRAPLAEPSAAPSGSTAAPAAKAAEAAPAEDDAPAEEAAPPPAG